MADELPDFEGGAGKLSEATPVVIAAIDSEYEHVAASQTDQALGTAGAVGDYLTGLLVVPATTSPGAVLIQDGADTAITVFAGGASSVAGLAPIPVPLGITSRTGAWQITTGANVSLIAVGKFS